MMTQPVLPYTTGQQRRIVWFGLALTIVMDTLAQLSWKYAVEQVPGTIGLWQSVIATLSEPWLYVALLLYILQFFNWMIVLSHADLSYAQPITALSYVTVSGASSALFHERLSLLRQAGLIMVLLGVWFISRTSHRTTGTVSGQSEQPEALR
jgi:multidrug transporter EmrE-like cation transporter